MRRRKSVNKYRSARKFKATARRTRLINVRAGMRGGIRL